MNEIARLLLFEAILFAFLLLAHAAGARLRRRVVRSHPSPDGSNEPFFVTTAFALLAFLASFTFNMALDRFEARREMVVAEANAISSAYRIVQLLPDPERARISAQLQDYVRLRLAVGKAEPHEKPRLSMASRRRFTATTEEVDRAVQRVITTALAPTLVTSMNEVSDVAARREAETAATVPRRVLAVLIGYLVTAAFMLGYALAGQGQAHRLETVLLLALFVVALGLIFDLDMPQAGGVTISETPLEQLAADLAAPTKLSPR